MKGPTEVEGNTRERKLADVPAAPAHGERIQRDAAAEHAPRRASAVDRIRIRLLEGPVTNHELAAITPRYGARIYDLRQLGMPIESKSLGNGVYQYRVVR